MSGQSLIIVGAGIAGISTGLYARLNGFQTTIFEMHRIPGGLCTAWKRKGYTFDISMHMLVGSKSGPFHKMWEELGVLQDQKFYYHQGELMRIVGRGKTLSLDDDPSRLEEQLLALAPADAALSKEFMRLFTGRSIMGAASLKAEETSTPLDGIKMFSAVLPLLGHFRKYSRTTLQEFTARFQDPFLRDALRFFIDSPSWPMPDYPMFALSGFLKSGMTEAGVPLGGSQKVVLRMEERYRSLGGEVRYASRVKQILIESDRAVGVRLEDGTERRADAVVWAADGHTAIFDLLAGRYVDERVRRMYEQWTPVQPLVHVCLGVARDMTAEPPRLAFELEEPITIAGEQRRWLAVLQRSYDPSLAPPGRCVVEVWYPTRFEYWQALEGDRNRYEEEKRRIAELTVRELDRHWSGFASQVEVVDVPTPLTYVRYTGNWKGSPDGWYVTAQNVMQRRPLRSLPGLDDFYTVGQWTAPFTGTVIAALSGRQLVELLCRRGHRRFLAEGPAPTSATRQAAATPSR